MSAIVVDSVFKLWNIYFPQTFLEECKRKIKEKEIQSSFEIDSESSDDDNSE